MLRHAWWVIGYCLLMGCASLNRAEYGTTRWRPALLVERLPWHAGIMNPKPPHYGLDASGGCIAMGEFRVEIDSLSFDSATHRLTMRVYVTQAGSTEWTYARLVTRGPNGEAVSNAFVRESGDVLSVDPQVTPVLSVEGIGIRSLSLDLLRLSRRAERRSRTLSVKPGDMIM